MKMAESAPHPWMRTHAHTTHTHICTYMRSKAPAVSALPSSSPDMPYVVPGEVAEKPRRSRMLSDDARLALRLQKEELKAAARGATQLKASAPASAGSATETQVRVNKPGEESGMQLLLDACMLEWAETRQQPCHHE